MSGRASRRTSRPKLTRARPGAAVGYVQAARTRLPHVLEAQGSLPPGATHRTCWYGYVQGTCLGRAVRPRTVVITPGDAGPVGARALHGARAVARARAEGGARRVARAYRAD